MATQDRYGRTPLLYAVELEQEQVINRFLAKGAVSSGQLGISRKDNFPFVLVFFCHMLDTRGDFTLLMPQRSFNRPCPVPHLGRTHNSHRHTWAWDGVTPNPRHPGYPNGRRPGTIRGVSFHYSSLPWSRARSRAIRKSHPASRSHIEVCFLGLYGTTTTTDTD